MQYPMNVNLAGRSCVVLGGGGVALRKIRTLLDCGAEVLMIAPDAAAELKELADGGRISWQREKYRAGQLPGGFLFICATDDESVNRQAIAEAKDRGMLVNAPAQPELSDFTVPAVMGRGKLRLTVSTEQMSPACARWIREALEREFPGYFAEWLEIMASMREELKAGLPDSHSREKFWREVLDRELFALVQQGELEKAEVKIRNAASGYRIES